ncbi:hypothetical protein M231_04103 [Tremella mesenterica]|uniref:Uncharacterized protein n=1 Tax=Tremella mesenterica TaxID=5217 RepID=A0A4V1M3Z6_TREME|nr:hypothetical protein M231_04103 [Tremella mesenterica]
MHRPKTLEPLNLDSDLHMPQSLSSQCGAFPPSKTSSEKYILGNEKWLPNTSIKDVVDDELLLYLSNDPLSNLVSYVDRWAANFPDKTSKAVYGLWKSISPDRNLQALDPALG